MGHKTWQRLDCLIYSPPVLARNNILAGVIFFLSDTSAKRSQALGSTNRALGPKFFATTSVLQPEPKRCVHVYRLLIQLTLIFTNTLKTRIEVSCILSLSLFCCIICLEKCLIKKDGSKRGQAVWHTSRLVFKSHSI